jgi:hypothetical protein
MTLMCLRQRLMTATCCLFAATMLLGFSGCEDVSARQAAADLSKQVNDLKLKLETAETENRSLRSSLEGIQERIVKQLNDRMDKLSEQVLAVSKDLLDKVSKDADQTRATATAIVSSARGDYDKELASVKNALAGDIQKIREETKTTFEELKKYMDNQLKELYPYAYQPRRTDSSSKAPPEPDLK